MDLSDVKNYQYVFECRMRFDNSVEIFKKELLKISKKEQDVILPESKKEGFS